MLKTLLFPGKKKIARISKMIEKKGNFVVLTLNPEIYDKNSIKEAAKYFDKKLNLGFGKENFEIKIPFSKEAKTIAYEFGNFVLKIMKNKGVA